MNYRRNNTDGKGLVTVTHSPTCLISKWSLFRSDHNFRNFFTWLTFLILVATFIGSFGPSITYIFEIFGPEHRSKVTTLITGVPWLEFINQSIYIGIPSQFFFDQIWTLMTSVGYSLVALFAQLTRDWWWTMMCLMIITLLFPVLLHFFVPGTIRKILDFVNLNFFFNLKELKL